MDTGAREAESATSLALGGVMALVFGTFAVLAAFGEGWVLAGALGLVLLLLARKVSTDSPALPLIVSGLGAVALLGAAIDLFVRGV